MTHSIGFIYPRHHNAQQTSARLTLRTDLGNPNHHLWNNNGTWYVHYTIAENGHSGERQRHSLGTKYLREARCRRDRLFASLEGGAK